MRFPQENTNPLLKILNFVFRAEGFVHFFLCKKKMNDEDEDLDDPLRFEKCFMCQAPLPIQDTPRKRFRKCRTCINRGTKRGRERDPVRYLHYKWRSRKPKRDYVAELYTLQTVRNVYERCQHKSVLSNEDDYKVLCVAGKVKQPKTEADLVLLTTKEALGLAKRKTDEARLRVFELASVDPGAFGAGVNAFQASPAKGGGGNDVLPEAEDFAIAGEAGKGSDASSQ